MGVLNFNVSNGAVLGVGCRHCLQACKALKEEGYTVVLVNSNPATIMTDPGTADRTYVTPMTPELVEKVGVDRMCAGGGDRPSRWSHG